MKEHKKRPSKWTTDLGSVIEVIWNNKQHLFVAIEADVGSDQFEVFDTIVHESVHVWQMMRAWIGEDASEGSPPKPASEIEAYSIAFIAQTIFKEYSCRT